MERVFRRRRRGVPVLLAVYVLLGVVVASSHHYLSNLHGLRGVASAVLAVFLWPLLLLGIDLHIRR
jgi:hypothetical protein